MNDEAEREPVVPSMLINKTIEYKPSRTELLRENEINIHFHSVGCVISVGCKSVPFSTIDEGMIALNAYVKNPFEEKKKWDKIFDDNNRLINN